MRKILILSLLIPALVVQAAYRLSSRRISVVDGLQGNTVDAIVQDRQGYIWMGGTGGLSRFDGNSFVDFTRAGDPNAKTSRHIGLLDYDDKNNLLWVTSLTYNHSCLDLNTGQYVDYTGKGDFGRYFRKYYFKAPDMWLYTDTYGIRHVHYADGRFSMRDYTQFRDVSYLTSDGDGNIWAISRHAVIRIDKEGKLDSYRLRSQLVDLRASGSNIVCMTGDNTALIFSSGSMKPRKAVLPLAMGSVSNVTTSMIWQGRYIVFTDRETYSLDIEEGVFSKSDVQVPGGLSQGHVDGWQFIANKEKGTLWMFPEKGKARSFDLFPGLGVNSGKGRIFHVVKDRQGRLVVASYGGGLFLLNLADGKVFRISASDSEPLIWSDYIFAILNDRSGCLWLGCESAGVACIIPQDGVYADYVLPSGNVADDRANYVNGIFRSADGEIILSTMDNKLYSFDVVSGKTHYMRPAEPRLHTCYTDRFGRVWRGTKGNGLFVGKDHYTSSDASYHVPVDDFYDIVGEDSHGRIWLATWRGGLLWAKNVSEGPIVFHQLFSGNFNQSRINDLELTSSGSLYVATLDGLFWFDTQRQNPVEKDFVCYNLQNGSLPANEIYCLHVKDDGSLWMGVLGNGVLKCTFTENHSALSWKAVRQDNGLSNNNVISITEDKNGNLWLGTEEGISFVSSVSHARSYQFSRSLMGNVCSEACALTLDDGRMLFGTHAGLVVITPENDMVGEKNLKPHVTDIVIEGRSVFSDSILSDEFHAGGPVSLSHDQNSVVFRYSNFDYANSQSTLYQYRLEGVDHDWLPVTNRKEAIYSSLLPGRYVFHIRTLSDDGWSQETVLRVHISQPWYNTWWMWMIYILLLSVAVSRLWRYYRRRIAVDRQASEIIRSIEPSVFNDKVVALVSSSSKLKGKLKRALGGHFRFDVYSSSDEAIRELVSKIPSAVICDAAIDGGRGFEVVSRLRDSTEAIEVPVVLLAHNHSDSDKIKAYECGADDCMSRMFNSRLLLARVAQLISWEKKRQEHASSAVAAITADKKDNIREEKTDSAVVAAASLLPEEDSPLKEIIGSNFTSVQDKRFKARLDYFISQHIGDSDMTIDNIADMVQMGHTKFYGKVKEITGMTPNRYLMNERMRIAGEMLLDGRYNVSEVSYRVGFQDQSYFNKCFKKHYGVVPSKYGR